MKAYELLTHANVLDEECNADEANVYVTAHGLRHLITWHIESGGVAAASDYLRWIASTTEVGS